MRVNQVSLNRYGWRDVRKETWVEISCRMGLTRFVVDDSFEFKFKVILPIQRLTKDR